MNRNTEAPKRQRPPMPPLSVRVQVAEKTLATVTPSVLAACNRGFYTAKPSNSTKLEVLLGWIRFELNATDIALDHDPALILRPYNPRIKDVAARYTPHAHDPAALIYREKQDHQQKTTGRKPGAARTITTKGSDVGLKSKFNRLEGRTKKRPTAKIAQRKNPWPKREMRQ